MCPPQATCVHCYSRLPNHVRCLSFCNSSSGGAYIYIYIGIYYVYFKALPSLFTDVTITTPIRFDRNGIHGTAIGGALVFAITGYHNHTGTIAVDPCFLLFRHARLSKVFHVSIVGHTCVMDSVATPVWVEAPIFVGVTAAATVAVDSVIGFVRVAVITCAHNNSISVDRTVAKAVEGTVQAWVVVRGEYLQCGKIGKSLWNPPC